MGWFFRTGAKIQLASLGIDMAKAAYDAYEQVQATRAELADPTRNMDVETKNLYYSLIQFRQNGDWIGYNKFCDRMADPIPQAERLRMWESLTQFVT